MPPYIEVLQTVLIERNEIVQKANFIETARDNDPAQTEGGEDFRFLFPMI